VAYKLALPPSMKVDDVFHVSLPKRYVWDVDHVIYWSILQMEPKGKFYPNPQWILQHKELVLQN